MLDVRVLGPVAAYLEDRRVPIGGRLARTVLATLALQAGRVVSVDRLVDTMWGDFPPQTARDQVHNQVSRLRSALSRAGATSIVVTDADGYALSADNALVDLAQVGVLLKAAQADRAGHRPTLAVAQMRQALDMWSGYPLGGVTAHLAAQERPRLEELRLILIEQCVEAELLSDGAGDHLVPELTALVIAYPLDERWHAMRIRALYKAGRTADALAAYHEARHILRQELGIDPSMALRDIQMKILGGRIDQARGPRRSRTQRSD
jgi:DNA-binding SARP family transcriptional activator